MAKNKITKLRVESVAFVDEGSCSKAYVQLYKRKDGKSMDKVEKQQYPLESLKSQKEGMMDNEGEGGEEKKKLQEPVGKEMKMDNMQKEMMPTKEGMYKQDNMGGMEHKEMMEMMMQPDYMKMMAGYMDDSQKQQMMDYLSMDMNKTMHGGRKEMMDKAMTEKAETTMMKGMDPIVKAKFEALEKRAQAAEAIAKRLEEESITKRYQEEVALFKNVPGDKNEIAKMLRILDTQDTELAKSFRGTLLSTSEALGEAIFKEKGVSIEGRESSAWDKIEKAASKVSIDKQISKSEAINQVLETQPELYTAYQRELYR